MGTDTSTVTGTNTDIKKCWDKVAKKSTHFIPIVFTQNR